MHRSTGSFVLSQSSRCEHAPWQNEPAPQAARPGADNPPQATLQYPHDFPGEHHAGQLGPQRYVHLQAFTQASLTQHGAAQFPDTHHVVLQLDGSSLFDLGGQTLRLQPGDMLLLHHVETLTIEHEGPVEQLVLPAPLTPHQLSALNDQPWVWRAGSRPLVKMAFEWARDACLHGPWHGDRAGPFASALASLLAQALRHTDTPATPSPAPKPDTTSITAYIRAHIDDPDLGLPGIAEAFGCGLRTLHRSFKQEGNAESLERCLWRLRIEACADVLRQRDAVQPLTDLAMRFGFSSSAHFSTLFRKLMGMSPSAYRARHAQGAA